MPFERIIIQKNTMSFTDDVDELDNDLETDDELDDDDETDDDLGDEEEDDDDGDEAE